MYRIVALCIVTPLHTNSPWVCVIKVCSNGGTTYFVGEIIAMQRQFEHRKFDATFENLLLQNYTTKFLDIAH